MPSGKVHDAITVIAAAVTAPVWWLAAPAGWNEPGMVATLCGATLFSGLMLSPDLDLDSSIYRRWGPLRVFWWPYQKAMPHRSFLSHSLVLAPLVRIAYFLVVAFLLLRGVTWALNYFVEFDRNALTRHYSDSLLGLWVTHPRYVSLFFVGLLWGTALHVGADVFVSALKRGGRRRRRRR
jgi:uncharacterized metal-binding protein